MRCSSRVAAILLALAILGACGPLPRPFKPDQVPGVTDKQAVNPLLNPHVGESVAVTLDGPAPVEAAARAEALAESLAARGVPATARPLANPRYRLVGRPELVALPPDEPSGDGPPAMDWQLYDEAGAPRGAPLRQERRDGAAALAQRVAAMLEDEAAPGPVAIPPTVRRAVALARVAGAPGDGAAAMPRALAAVLPRLGIPYEADPEAASLRVELQVAVRPRDARTEQVELDWMMRDPAGETVATLAQSNAIPKGTLDRSWGSVAYDIAVAASDGLAAALNRPTQPTGARGHRLETPPDILSLRPSLRRVSEEAQKAAEAPQPPVYSPGAP